MSIKNILFYYFFSYSVYGEIVVKQFEGVQTGLPLCVLGGFVPPAVKLSYK